jgi:hypothetical protein
MSQCFVILFPRNKLFVNQPTYSEGSFTSLCSSSSYARPIYTLTMCGHQFTVIRLAAPHCPIAPLPHNGGEEPDLLYLISGSCAHRHRCWQLSEPVVGYQYPRYASSGLHDWGQVLGCLVVWGGAGAGMPRVILPSRSRGVPP